MRKGRGELGRGKTGPREAGRRPGEAARAGEKGGRAGLGWKQGRAKLGGLFCFFFKPFQTFKLNYKHFKSFQD
jgi:hypothetical protein